MTAFDFKDLLDIFVERITAFLKFNISGKMENLIANPH